MQNDIMFLKEKAARLEAIIETGEAVDPEELQALASDVNPDSFSASSTGVNLHAIFGSHEKIDQGEGARKGNIEGAHPRRKPKRA